MIDNVEDLDIVMPMYNLSKFWYSQNYSTTSGSLWNYYRDEVYEVDSNALGKSFEYKTKIVGKTPARSGNEGDANQSPAPTFNVKATIPFKYLTNFWRSLNLPLINHEI